MMNYAAANNAISYQGAQTASAMVAPPRTIASAIGRVEGLNERLSQVREHLSSISDQIGGPRPAESGNGKANLPGSGAVGRLNDSVEGAHDCLSDIEDLLGSISRALGCQIT
ncbi:MAG: hypothetical protein JWP25_4706 [Bradyrhizobium sp.]|nr:hypothetical protein [Bradyrhizobium sp.]